MREDIVISKPKGFSVKIADVVIQSSSDEMALEPNIVYRAFVVDDTKPDITLHMSFGGIPDISLEKKIFDSGGPWSLYEFNGKYLFTYSSPIITPNLYKVAIFDTDFSHGDLYIGKQAASFSGSRDPLNYPLDEVLMVNYLAQGRGIDIHAVGMIAPNSFGIAFVGVSGAGKSTTANLWRKQQNVKLLCDDRIILRKQGGEFWMYSTPWHGDAGIAVPGEAPLKSLFFLKQAKENQIIPLKPTDIATRLMVRCFPTFYDVKGMEFTLSFITELANKVPCYELHFTPDQRSVDKVLEHVKRASQ
jgi:hypothetical protein